MLRSRPRPPLGLLLGVPLVTAAAAGAVAAGLPAEDATAATSCPTPSSTVATAPGIRAWTSKGALRVCVRRGGRATTRRYGPWTTKSRIRLDEDGVVWTTRTTRSGRPVDRIWARAEGERRRWMGGLRAIPTGGPQEDRLRALVTGTEVEGPGDDGGPAAAWVTRSGAVVVARSASVQGPGDEARTLVERLPAGQIDPVAGSLAIDTRTTVVESCVSSTTNVVTARRTAGGPVEVLAEGTTRENDDPPGDTTCIPGTYR